MLEHFRQFGEVKKAYIIFDPKTCRYKDFGFIEFKSKKSAEAALTQEDHKIKSRSVTVSRYNRNNRTRHRNQTSVLNPKSNPSDFQQANLETVDTLKKGMEEKEQHELSCQANAGVELFEQSDNEEGREGQEGNGAVDSKQEYEQGETPNQKDFRRHLDLTEILEIFSDKDREERIDQILVLSKMKYEEEKYFSPYGYNFEVCYRLNYARLR